MTDQPDEREVLRILIDNLHKLDNEVRIRILKTAETFFGVNGPSLYPAPTPWTPVRESTGSVGSPTFADRTQLSPKAFLLQKEPATEIERVACLAYYLTHYRDTPHFKTIDISQLNTEAAQVKFSNAAYAVSNAARAALLAPTTKGAKQITAVGERLVDALPDREAVKALLASARRRRTRKKRRRQENQQPEHAKDQ